MRGALQEGRLAEVGELMNINQGYLSALGVSTPELERLCTIARDEGALGAKLTGAGGGGAVIALVDEGADRVAQAFKQAGYFSFCAQAFDEVKTNNAS
jgi:hydroxymethylglutaryl-CoA reductase